MSLYALDTVIHRGREYAAGAELPKKLDSDVADDLIERGLATKTAPKTDEGDTVDLSKLKVKQLEDLADTRGLDRSAATTKPQLLELLEPSDDQPPEQP